MGDNDDNCSLSTVARQVVPCTSVRMCFDSVYCKLQNCLLSQCRLDVAGTWPQTNKDGVFIVLINHPSRACADLVVSSGNPAQGNRLTTELDPPCRHAYVLC